MEKQDTLDEIAQLQIECNLKAAQIDSLKKMFSRQQLHGGVADADAVAASQKAVGQPLRTFDAFVGELTG